MMLVPNFMPRRSVVIVVKKVENKKEPVGCQDCDCDYPISDCCNDTPCIYFGQDYDHAKPPGEGIRPRAGEKADI